MIKSVHAFKTIGEVAEMLDVEAHVLRFWESKFPHIKIVKSVSGRRMYRAEDIQLIIGIKHMLYDMGMTIKGVQKLLRDKGKGVVSQSGADIRNLQNVLKDKTHTNIMEELILLREKLMKMYLLLQEK